MSCAACGHENPPDAKFCAQCAAPLVGAGAAGETDVSAPEDVDDRLDDSCQYFGFEVADTVQDDRLIGRKQPIRSYVARLPQAPLLEVAVVSGQCAAVADRLAGDLAQEEVVTLQISDDERRAALGLREVQEWEGNNDKRRPLQIAPSCLFFR